MKTKKAILEWWEKLGNKPTNRDDMLDLIESLDFAVNIKSITTKGKNKDTRIELMSKRWKYSLKLYFIINEHQKFECYRIVGH